jgi:predicted nucleic acid-binding protein
MPFALDASVVLAWVFPDEEGGAVAEAALDRLDGDHGTAPALWWFEVRNALIAGERRQRLNARATGSFLRWLSRLPIVTDALPDEAKLLDLSRRYRLTVYDAAYLEVAHRHGIPLATTDNALRGAARRIGVALVGE